MVARWKLLRDAEAPVRWQGMLIANDGPLRTLHRKEGQSSFTIAKSWSSWVLSPLLWCGTPSCLSIAHTYRNVKRSLSRLAGFYKQLTDDTLHDDNWDAAFR
jgi:hypothetical protein